MKESSEWVRQKTVDEAASKIVVERQCTVAEVKPYWVAKKLGVDPSGEIYEKVYDWQRRAEAENAGSAVVVPAEAEAEFRNALDHLTAAGMASFIRAVRMAGGAFDHAAGLRVADAELRANRANAARVDVLALCREAETERDEGVARIVELEHALAEAQRQIERLTGRLEQRAIDDDNKTERLAKIIETDADGAPTTVSDDDAAAPSNVVKESAEPVTAAEEGSIHDAGAEIDGAEEAPVDPADPPQDDQVELPFETHESDVQSDNGGLDED